MRTAALIFVLLFASTASAAVTDGACAAVSHEACAHLDYADIGSPAATVAYDALFTSVSGIAPSMQYNTLPQALRAEVWVKFQEAVDNSGVLPVTAPADYPADPWASSEGVDGLDLWTTYTQAEAFDVYSSKVAHAFYLDINNVFPWKLVDIPAAHLDGLFRAAGTPDGWGMMGNLFHRWDPGGTPLHPSAYASDNGGNISDFSPSETLAVVRLAAGMAHPFTGSQRDAVNIIIDWFGTQMNHGYPAINPYWTLSPMDMWSASNIFDPGGANKYISRSGCHSSSTFLAALMRSINIPVQRRHGRAAGSGHEQIIIPTINGVLNHGDDIYAPGSNGLGVAMLDDFACWEATSNTIHQAEAECLAGTCTPATQAILLNLSQRRRWVREMRYVDSDDLANFCILGWAAYRAPIDVYFDTCEEYRFTAYNANLQALSGCNGNPGQSPP